MSSLKSLSDLSGRAVDLWCSILLKQQLCFDLPWVGGSLQRLDGEGGVEAGLHVVISGALLGAAGWRALGGSKQKFIGLLISS